MADKKLTKFDFVVGNPPYQNQTTDNANRQEPIYNVFMDASYSVADKVELITPARFLFNAGQTPNQWNKKMLNDEHFKVLHYEIDSEKVFPNTDIKGGVAITYRDKSVKCGAIKTFIPYNELNSICNKVKKISSAFFNEIITGQSNFNLDELYVDFPSAKNKIHSNGRSKQIRSNAFEKFPEIFINEKDEMHKFAMYGIEGRTRITKYVNDKYIEKVDINNFYKIMIPQANGSGAIGETLSTPVMGTPVMGTPVMGYTQSFIGVGKFSTELEAKNCLKYVKTKFCRAMLGTLKVTQNNAAPEIWSNVPIQDFTNKSDIDWSKSIKEIDQQLYKKYGLSEDEIKFIEEKVKEMA